MCNLENIIRVKSLGLYCFVVVVLLVLVSGGVYFAKRIATNNSVGQTASTRPADQSQNQTPGQTGTSQSGGGDTSSNTPGTGGNLSVDSTNDGIQQGAQTTSSSQNVLSKNGQVPSTGPSDLIVPGIILSTFVFGLVLYIRVRLGQYRNNLA